MANIASVCLLALCFASLSLAKVTPKECTKGPEYWCENLRNAANCGAVHHCIQTVWKNQNTQLTNKHDPNAYFVLVLKELKDMRDMINEKYVAARLYSACLEYEDPLMRERCKQNTNNLGPYIIAVLQSELSPVQLCKLAEICDQKTSQDNHTPHVVLGEHKCSWGPSYWCDGFESSHQCNSSHYCLKKVWKNLKLTEDHNNGCQECIKIVSKLENDLFKNNETEVVNTLREACDLIPHVLERDACKLSSHVLLPIVMDAVKEKIEPHVICHLFKTCQNKEIENAMDQRISSTPKNELVGANKCTWGPSFWCNDFGSSHQCGAANFCTTKVWSSLQVPEDDDSICKICKDMVQQARDNLQSNDTQEMLKEVFEGSCKLIPLKIVQKECMKISDEFIPELVETLSSEMNPTMVCTVAGLCNNAEIDKLLEQYKPLLQERIGCMSCHKTVGVLRKRFDESSDQDFLYGMLQFCGEMSSLSDSCSALVFKYFENIREALRKDLKPQSTCFLSGQCQLFEDKPNVFTEISIPEPKSNDDVPCEFCEQLVLHLRDVVIANSTEWEFYDAMKNVCKQLHSFKGECLNLVEEYYAVAYNYLVSEIKPKELCTFVGICGKKSDVHIAPLLPSDVYSKAKNQLESMSTKKNVEVIQPLPLERMLITLPKNKAACTFCQYFLHYLQVEISDEATEDEIRDAVDKACDVLPKSVNDQCRNFVTEYGPAVIAMLVQEIDPATVCPALGMCDKVAKVENVAINVDKSNCPLCLFAVEQLETLLENNRTESNIRHALENLCSHLSQKVRTECSDFVDTYSKQLIQMIVANMDAQEICVYLKLCKSQSVKVDPFNLQGFPKGMRDVLENPSRMADGNHYKRNHKIQKQNEDAKSHAVGDIETNEIPDNTRNGQPLKPKVTQKTVCVVCEFVLQEIESQIKDKHNEDEVKKVVHSVCNHMPKTVRPDCNQFVEKYADLVISLLVQDLDPSRVCTELKLCGPTMNTVRSDVLNCAVCEAVVSAVKKALHNKKTDESIVHVIEKSCVLLPAKYMDRCESMLNVYGESIINLIEDYGAKAVCGKIGLCDDSPGSYVQMYREKNHD